jgi:phosphoglycerate dehydrogenase-like enzyme
MDRGIAGCAVYARTRVGSWRLRGRVTLRPILALSLVFTCFVVRLDSPAATHTPAQSSTECSSHAPQVADRLGSLFVLDENYFAMLYGSSERAELNRFARFAHPRVSSAELLANGTRYNDVEAIMAGWGMPSLDEAMLNRFPRLRILFYAAGTIRPVVTKASWRRGIRVTTASLANAKPVAEFTLAAIIFSLKRVWERVRNLRERNLYQQHSPRIPGCFETTVGLLGLGKIGRRVAERLRDMDVRVIVYDPYVLPQEAIGLGVKLCSLEEVFASADVVSCHLPLTPETRRLINRRLLRQMKPDGTFINTARGAVVDEPDLIAILTERPDLYAVLDTIADEPPAAGHPLLRLPNAIVTPHIAGSMCHECRRMGIMMVDELRRYMSNEPLLGEVREDDLELLA